MIQDCLMGCLTKGSAADPDLHRQRKGCSGEHHPPAIPTRHNGHVCKPSLWTHHDNPSAERPVAPNNRGAKQQYLQQQPVL